MTVIRFLHQFRFLRTLARNFAQRLSISQNFYSGKIYLNAFQHKWAYLGDTTFENHDNDLQKRIVDLSVKFDLFVDIGCNVGVMTLATLLHNKKITAVAVDTSATAVALVNKSLKANRLSSRCKVINAAIGDEDGTVLFDDNFGDAMAAVKSNGTPVKQISLSTFLNEYNGLKLLVKIDTEGFETLILKDLKHVRGLELITFLIEIHPLGYHNGNPAEVFNILKQSDGIVKTLDNVEVTYLPSNEISQVLVSFS